MRGVAPETSRTLLHPLSHVFSRNPQLGGCVLENLPPQQGIAQVLRQAFRQGFASALRAPLNRDDSHSSTSFDPAQTIPAFGCEREDLVLPLRR